MKFRAICLLLLAACSTTREAPELPTSPYIVDHVVTSMRNFTHQIQNGKREEISAVQLIYPGEPISPGKVLPQQDGSLKVIYDVYFTWRAGAGAKIRILTKDNKVHEFKIGDPWDAYDRQFFGTTRALK